MRTFKLAVLTTNNTKYTTKVRRINNNDVQYGDNIIVNNGNTIILKGNLSTLCRIDIDTAINNNTGLYISSDYGNTWTLNSSIPTSGGWFVSISASGQYQTAGVFFEYIYFARPDSYVRGRHVYDVRKKMGAELAREAPVEADVIVPVPDSGVPAAIGYAQESGIPFELGIVRNHYVGRTFIQPTQSIRELGVRLKHSANRSVVQGKRIVLIDDSIVRGTTSREIVQMARDAGARKVYLASAAPPVRFPNVYGIDMPTSEELVAYGRTVEEVREWIGCDALIYQDVAPMMEAVKKAASPGMAVVEGFDASCFDGTYITGDINAQDVARLNRLRVGVDETSDASSRLSLHNADSH